MTDTIVLFEGVPHGLRQKCDCVPCNVLRKVAYSNTDCELLRLRSVPPRAVRPPSRATAVEPADEALRDLPPPKKAWRLDDCLVLIYGGIWLQRCAEICEVSAGRYRLRCMFVCDVLCHKVKTSGEDTRCIRVDLAPAELTCGDPFLEQWIGRDDLVAVLERFRTCEELDARPGDIVWEQPEGQTTLQAQGAQWRSGRRIYDLQVRTDNGVSAWKTAEIAMWIASIPRLLRVPSFCFDTGLWVCLHMAAGHTLLARHCCFADPLPVGRRARACAL